jgi:uncharacterized protein DUF5763
MQSSSTDALRTLSQCLHLGRSGNRCSRAALEDGFCERHSPNAPAQFAFTASRKIAAIFLALAVLWPILLDLYRAFHH